MSWYSGYRACLTRRATHNAYECSESISKEFCGNKQMEAFNKGCPQKIAALNTGNVSHAYIQYLTHKMCDKVLQFFNSCLVKL